jgi:putative ABC transport system permease protein
MPRWFSQLRLILRSLFCRSGADQELDEELQYHLDRQIAEGLNGGLTPTEARHAALRAMGAITQSKEVCRDMRRVNWIDDFGRDLHYAGRNLRKDPGFSGLAVLIMALGIGANTAVFSVVNAVLLRPLPYRDPDRIVTLATVSTANKTRPEQASLAEQVSLANFEDWHDQSTSFEALANYVSQQYPVMAGNAAEYARATQVAPEFLRVFGVEPVVGRAFNDEEMKPGSGGAALISYAYWQSRLGGDPAAVGQTLRVYGRPLPVIGVMPPDFLFPDKTDVWLPRRIGPEDRKYRGAQNWLVVGRLKRGVSLERAQSEMGSIGERLAQQYPNFNKGFTIGVTAMRDQMVRDYRMTLYLLWGAVSFVLLIACANTATLLLGKASARTREVALRAALGASRGRILRQLITESLVLAVVAGAAGLLLAYAGSKALSALAPAGLSRLAEARIDRWVLAFALSASILTSFLFGLIPALHASRVDLNEALKQGMRSVIGGGRVRMRGALVAIETALAVVLLCGAGLLMKSFVALHQVVLGFRPENVLLMKATVPIPGPSQAAGKFFRDLLPKVAHMPGVVSAGASMAPPGQVASTVGYFVDHLPAQPEWASAPSAVMSVIAPGTFAALGIPIKSGRDFNDADTDGSPLVAIVNEALVRKSFGGRSPIGRTIFCPFDTLDGMAIVGVAGDVRQRGPAVKPSPECYVTYRQHAFNQNALTVIARTVGDPNVLINTLRHLAHDTSPDVPVTFTTMEMRLSDDVATPRFRTLLLGIFAGIALCLAMAGVYGVMGYAVRQRTNEIGVRIALGAGTGSVLRMVLGQGLSYAGAGLILGLVAASASSRVLTSMLFQVQPNDPLVYLFVSAFLAATALVASYIPARHASKIDPMEALRCE